MPFLTYWNENAKSFKCIAVDVLGKQALSYITGGFKGYKFSGGSFSNIYQMHLTFGPEIPLLENEFHRYTCVCNLTGTNLYTHIHTKFSLHHFL